MGRYEDAVDQARTVMIGVARARATISYSGLTREITALPIEPDSQLLANILDEISIEQDKAGRGMLSAVVVHATGDYLPGPGFFKLGARLGRDVSDRVAFHAEELRGVHEAFAR